MARFENLDELLWWLSQDVFDAYCANRERMSYEGECGCDGCILDGEDECPTAVIELARSLNWKDEDER